MNTTGQLGRSPFADLTPEQLTKDITYYQRKAAELDSVTNPREVTLRSLYRTLATNRQRLLAALRDGHPDLWTDYTDQASGTRPL